MRLVDELDALFDNSPTATTDDVARLLGIRNIEEKNRPRAIRARLDRLGYPLVMISNYTWVKP